ncbi:thioredoxin domain-containing protein [Fodinicurvata sp. EGI_FJ10296]|uniref:thioredoxin domain-containing protein n=1 Tax=Fodinicurvata sp. EGI_FJ10296 TaxID=3231908 RepID=UPI00345283B8
MTQNRLADSASPYLLQHADNPVHWYPWGSEALATAKAENKPILLSIGYAACHWCHVMAHESFEDPAIAEVMNQLFVNIKVDREERPDIDQIYMNALVMTGQPGGWPLTMFLTPDGHPFWGGTYFPSVPKFGRPGFAEVLKLVSQVYHQDPDKVAGNVDALRTALARLSESESVEAVDPAIIDQAAEQLAAEMDPVHGGIKGAPKFPQVSVLTLIWHAARRTGSPALAATVELAVRRMCQGGIYDHLGGGFSRYSVDDQWLVPHFEKMLYDNAQLLDLLLMQWLATDDPLFSHRIHETVAWLDREMTLSNGAFAASLDADSEGEEGRFYIWTQKQIREALDDAVEPETMALLEKTYDITPEGNWEGVTILNRRHADGLPEPSVEQALTQPMTLMFQARSKRVRPALDDKVLADWNGLTIAALARCGATMNQPDWTARAARAFNAVVDALGDGDRLFHAWRDGRRHQIGMLTDYAAMIQAALALFMATGQSKYLQLAVGWADTTEERFADRDAGGYFLTADDAEALIVRTKSIHDNAEPSGNGSLLIGLARLYHLTGEQRFADRAEGIIRAFGGALQRNIFPLASYLAGIDHLYNAETVIIVGENGDPATEALGEAARNVADPRRMVVTVSDTSNLPESHPAAGKTRVQGQATAYRCQGMMCYPPVTNPADLKPDGP